MQDTSGHDHTRHHKMMIKDFRRRFYISVIATAPIPVLSEFIQSTFGFTISIPGSSYIIRPGEIG